MFGPIWFPPTIFTCHRVLTLQGANKERVTTHFPNLCASLGHVPHNSKTENEIVGYKI
jgi:hypothetical protein